MGEITATLVDPARLVEYPVWMWHRGDPDHPDIDWNRMRSIAIDPAAKQRSLAEYASQTEGESPVVSAAVLDAATTDREAVFVEADPIGAYLDRAYVRGADPWRVESRWYEQRKRAITLAGLPAARYRRALEVCYSIGVLTADLAERCDELLAIDLSAAAAVERARTRLEGRAGVTMKQLDIREGAPAGPFDLVVLSEVGYYLTHSQLDAALAAIDGLIGDRGTLLAYHWRHPVADHVLSGDEVHAVIAARGLPRIARHEEADFVLDVYSRDACSVAQHEGIA